jgi:hypothetical protein
MFISGAVTNMINRGAAGVCLLFLLGACSQEALMQKFASPAEQSIARTYIDQLGNHEFAEIEKAADTTIAGPSLDGTLGRMADLIPTGSPISVKLVGAQHFSASGVTTVNLTFEYQFPDRWVLANVATKSKDGATTIVGFNVYPEPSSLETANRFTLSGRSALQYIVLGAAIVAAIFTLAWISTVA